VNCPKCRSPHFYVGVITLGDCGNPACEYFRGGTVNGARVEAHSQPAADQRGWVVLRQGRDLPCEEYVFATRADAERWRDLNGLLDAKPRPVTGAEPFQWTPSRGTVRGIILADRLFSVFPPGYPAPEGPAVHLVDGEP
jgi:hypothetical protein